MLRKNGRNLIPLFAYHYLIEWNISAEICSTRTSTHRGLSCCSRYGYTMEFSGTPSAASRSGIVDACHVESAQIPTRWSCSQPRSLAKRLPAILRTFGAEKKIREIVAEPRKSERKSD